MGLMGDSRLCGPSSFSIVSRLLYTGEGFGLVGWNDTRHLEGGALDELG